ncbi:MAG: hypothetical protein ACYDEA_04715 [Candidatus Dormibacteria bacterium]
MSSVEVLALATVGLAVVTTASVGVSVYFAERERRTVRAGAFRAALVEQAENCRHWLGHKPAGMGQPVPLALVQWSPAFAHFEKLVATVDLPADLFAQLLWQVAAAKDAHQICKEQLRGEHISSEQKFREVPWHNDWWRVLHHMQTVACLLRAEAKHRRYGGLATTFGQMVWFQPHVRPGSPDGPASPWAMRHPAVAWPTDSAFAECTEAVRDKEALELAAAEPSLAREELHRAP